MIRNLIGAAAAIALGLSLLSVAMVLGGCAAWLPAGGAGQLPAGPGLCPLPAQANGPVCHSTRSAPHRQPLWSPGW